MQRAKFETGLLKGLSVEFKAIRQRFVSGLRRISAAWLASAGLVDSPSYAGSRVEIRGANLAEALNDSIGDRDRATLIERMAMSSELSRERWSKF